MMVANLIGEKDIVKVGGLIEGSDCDAQAADELLNHHHLTWMIFTCQGATAGTDPQLFGASN